MTWDDWLTKCDILLAMKGEGIMTDDVSYDWRGAYEWGESPQDAVQVAVMIHDAREE